MIKNRKKFIIDIFFFSYENFNISKIERIDDVRKKKIVKNKLFKI